MPDSDTYVVFVVVVFDFESVTYKDRTGAIVFLLTHKANHYTMWNML